MSNSDAFSDPAMLELFRAEMDQHIPVLSEKLLTLERGSATQADIEALMRAAHSVKGAAKIVGLDPAVGVAHALEDCFTAAMKGRITLGSEAVDILLAGVDALQRILSSPSESTMDSAFTPALVERLVQVRDGRCPPPEPPQDHAAAGGVHQATQLQSTADLKLPERFDAAAARALLAAVHRGPSSAARPVRVNFGEVRQISATALAVLAVLSGGAGQQPASPWIVATDVPDPVRGLLRVTGLEGAMQPGGG